MGWLIRFRWPALCAGLVLLGAGLTYLLVPPTLVAEEAIEVNPADLVLAQQREAEPMPSLLGLNRDVAQTVLADAGLGAVPVTVTDKGAAGPVAMVLAQKPSAGTGSVSGIELTVSTAEPMPDIVGHPLEQARTQLEQLGAVVQIVSRFDPALPKGQILEVIPQVGDTLPTVATLTVSDPGEALTLATVSPVARDDCGTVDEASVNGGNVGDSVQCRPGRDPAYIEYSLARHAAVFEAVVGADDRGQTGPATVVIFGDGRELSRTDVGLGHSEPVRVDVAGVMRLRIEALTSDVDQRPTVLLGDARLLGLPDALDAIAAQ